jgi:cytochrome c553
VIRGTSGWRAAALATLFFSLAVRAAPSAQAIQVCESCHGKDGNSEMALVPSIAGQPATFLENQLIFFRERLRSVKPSQEGAPSMQDIARTLKDKQILELAAHFAKAPVRVTSPGKADPKLEAKGRQIVNARHCGQCHLPTFQGRAQMPRLAAQREDYLVDTMRAYREGRRTAADTTMTEVLTGLSDADLQALGHFLARRR